MLIRDKHLKLTNIQEDFSDLDNGVTSVFNIPLFLSIIDGKTGIWRPGDERSNTLLNKFVAASYLFPKNDVENWFDFRRITTWVGVYYETI